MNHREDLLNPPAKSCKAAQVSGFREAPFSLLPDAELLTDLAGELDGEQRREGLYAAETSDSLKNPSPRAVARGGTDTDTDTALIFG